MFRQSPNFEAIASFNIGISGLTQGLGWLAAAFREGQAQSRRQDKALPHLYLQLARHVRVPQRDGHNLLDHAATLLGLSQVFGQYQLEQPTISPTESSEANDLWDHSGDHEQY